MVYRKISNNDVLFGGGTTNFISGAEAIAQAIKTKLLLLYGEWWENAELGTPFIQAILGQYESEDLKKAASQLIEKRVKEVEGVVSVSDLEFSFSARNMKIKGTVETESDGSVTVEVEV